MSHPTPQDSNAFWQLVTTLGANPKESVAPDEATFDLLLAVLYVHPSRGVADLGRSARQALDHGDIELCLSVLSNAIKKARRFKLLHQVESNDIPEGMREIVDALRGKRTPEELIGELLGSPDSRVRTQALLALPQATQPTPTERVLTAASRILGKQP